MQLKNYNVYFFFSVLIGITVLTFFILKPFFVPFILAVVLAHSFNFIYLKLLKWTGNKKGFSSALVCLPLLLVVIILIYFVVNLAANEIKLAINNFSDTKNNVSEFITALTSLKLVKILGIERFINQEVLIAMLKNISQNSLAVFQGIYSSIAYLIFNIFVIFFSLFYIFIDGGQLIKTIMKLSPLKDTYENILIRKFNSIIHGIIKGTFVMAIIHGIIGGFLFWATGVPFPAFLGILMSLVSVIPPIGVVLIWLPVGIIMLVLGKFVAGAIILVSGVVIFGSLDNMFKPKLIGKSSQMHPLLILFSTLGGIILFGPVGLIVGPVVMSFFVVLWDIYSLEFKNQLEEYN